MATRLIPEESPLSKCMKCGALLPPVGECPACAKAAAQTTLPGLPSFLDRDLQIDRRSGMRDDGPAFAERSPAPPAPPSVAPLAGPLPPPAAPRAAAPQNPPGVARPTPPGMTPSHRPAPRAATPPPAAQPSWAQGGGFPVDVPPVPATAQTPMSAMTPAYGTPPVPPRVQPLVAPAPGLPRVETPAPAASLADTEPGSPMPSGLPWSAPEPVAPVSSGLPVMAALETPAPSASSLPAVESAPAPVSTGLPVMASAAPRAEKPKSVRTAAVQPGVAEVHARPASLWRRLLSFSIDAAAIGGVAALYITLASSVTGMKAPEAGLSGLDGFVAWLRALHTVLLPGFFLVLVLALVYCAVAAFLWNGRTLGRLLLGLRLVDTHGLAPAPGRAIVRAMLASLSFVLFLGGFWMALFDRRGQTLHDKLTSTFVVQPS